MNDSSAKHPKTVLDSVLSDNGPMPAAHMGIRIQAFFFDWVFVSMSASILVGILTPHFFPDAFVESNNWLKDFAGWIKQNGLVKGIPMPQWSEDFTIFVTYAQSLIFFIFWFYFAVSEALFSGYTFGKSICRLRTISVVTMKKPSILSAIARGGLKSLALLSPLFLLATMIVLHFNQRRQMGHDVLCRTAVIDERYLSSVDQIR